MQLTTRGRYAVTAILDIALHQQQGAVPLSDIASRQGLSSTYLEQLLSKLRRQGLIHSVRGPGGGYTLKRSPRHISVASIINAIDENIDVTLCKGKKNCRNGERCLTHNLWSGLGAVISGFLNRVTLDDLMTKGAVHGITQQQMMGGSLQPQFPLEPLNNNEEHDHYG